MHRVWVACVAAVICSLGGMALGKPQIAVPRPAVCNLFAPDQEVTFDASLNGFGAGEGELAAKVRNYFGQEVWKATQPVKLDGKKTGGREIERR